MEYFKVNVIPHSTNWGLPLRGSATRRWDWQKEGDTIYEVRKVVLPCFRNSLVVHVLLG